jgi:tRNA U34 5-methylaminomethyl-2-thiouridine-forming methyltransferase MnmC
MEKLGLSYVIKSLNDKFKYIEAIHTNREIIILLGDVRETFLLARKQNIFKYNFDAIFQDAFSPKKNPRLWTYEWFNDLSTVSKETTIMTTYSTTKATWKSMILAGWKVECFTGFGKKRMSTRAKRQGDSARDVLDWVAQSPINALKDENIMEQEDDITK